MQRLFKDFLRPHRNFRLQRQEETPLGQLRENDSGKPDNPRHREAVASLDCDSLQLEAQVARLARRNIHARVQGNSRDRRGVPQLQPKGTQETVRQERKEETRHQQTEGCRNGDCRQVQDFGHEKHQARSHQRCRLGKSH